jgi:hypothetical protein
MPLSHLLVLLAGHARLRSRQPCLVQQCDLVLVGSWLQQQRADLRSIWAPPCHAPALAVETLAVMVALLLWCCALPPALAVLVLVLWSGAPPQAWRAPAPVLLWCGTLPTTMVVLAVAAVLQLLMQHTRPHAVEELALLVARLLWYHALELALVEQQR